MYFDCLGRKWGRMERAFKMALRHELFTSHWSPLFPFSLWCDENVFPLVWWKRFPNLSDENVFQIGFRFLSPQLAYVLKTTKMSGTSCLTTGWGRMFHSSCPAAHPVLPLSNQTKWNQADSGIAKIKINPTQVRDVMPHPVGLNHRWAD